LLINDDPQGLSKETIFLNFKFSANETEEKFKKINKNKNIFFIN